MGTGLLWEVSLGTGDISLSAGDYFGIYKHYLLSAPLTTTLNAALPAIGTALTGTRRPWVIFAAHSVTWRDI